MTETQLPPSLAFISLGCPKNLVDSEKMLGLLAEAILKLNPGGKIVHDPRLTWNTQDIVRALGGTPIQSKTGHAFIKERMRLEDAVYGGEMSAHHYFRDFAYCDSGMVFGNLRATETCTPVNRTWLPIQWMIPKSFLGKT